MDVDKEPDFFSKQVTQARRFYSQKPKPKDSRIEVICGGCEHTTSDFQIDRKDFPFYCIEFVAIGFGSVKLNNRTFDLKPGSLFTYGPGISQKISTIPEQSMVKYFVDFKSISFKNHLSNILPPLGIAIQIKQPDEIARIWDDLLIHGASDSPFSPLLCSLLLEYLLCRITEMAVVETEVPTKSYITYQKCRNHIKKNYLSLYSLGDISKSCLVDKAYICRLFNRYDNQSPYQYLLSLKMADAANRFHDRDISIKEIAYELGFSDPYHFTRIFKKIYGISPQSFKNLR